MTRRIFSFDPPDRFVCGTVGQPGKRTFFLQATKGGQVVSVALEKQQVAVLAERLAALLVSLREVRSTDDPEETRATEAAFAQIAPVSPRVDASTPAEGSTAADASTPADASPLAEPVVELFRVGTLVLGWDGDRERVMIEARELRPPADDEDDEAEDVADDAPDGPDVVRVHLTAQAAEGFVTRALAVVRAGRPPCPMCGQPLDPGGHFCIRRNGYTH
jgi:uncharacterized repeat protein (TIGR03847 family)